MTKTETQVNTGMDITNSRLDFVTTSSMGLLVWVPLSSQDVYLVRKKSDLVTSIWTNAEASTGLAEWQSDKGIVTYGKI